MRRGWDRTSASVRMRRLSESSNDRAPFVARVCVSRARQVGLCDDRAGALCRGARHARRPAQGVRADATTGAAHGACAVRRQRRAAAGRHRGAAGQAAHHLRRRFGAEDSSRVWCSGYAGAEGAAGRSMTSWVAGRGGRCRW
eukprot:4420612-Prymnesium_polylepis.1